MPLTKQCKYLLKQIKLFTNNTTIEWNYNHEDNYIYKIKVRNNKMNLTKYFGELDALINALLNNGYITKSRFGFQLTHKGIHPYRVSFQEFKMFLLKSIFVPILVALLTALATMGLKGLL